MSIERIIAGHEDENEEGWPHTCDLADPDAKVLDEMAYAIFSVDCGISRRHEWDKNVDKYIRMARAAYHAARLAKVVR